MTNINETEAQETELLENPIYKLRKPFTFEDEKYTEFDLSCLDDLSRKDCFVYCYIKAVRNLR